MVTKRVTPEDDINRLAERIWERSREKLQTRDDFDTVFETYMTQDGQDLTPSQKRTLKQNVFDTVRRKHKQVKDRKGTTDERTKVFEVAAIKPSPKEFKFLGTSGGRRVFARRTIMTIQSEKQVRKNVRVVRKADIPRLRRLIKEGKGKDALKALKELEGQLRQADKQRTVYRDKKGHFVKIK